MVRDGVVCRFLACIAVWLTPCVWAQAGGRCGSPLDKLQRFPLPPRSMTMRKT